MGSEICIRDRMVLVIYELFPISFDVKRTHATHMNDPDEDEDEEDGGGGSETMKTTMQKSNNNNTNNNINLTFASLHALSAWLSVKSIVKTTTVILEKTTLVPGGDGAGKSMFSFAHAAMCLLNCLRSSVKTYREIRNTNIVKTLSLIHISEPTRPY